MRALLVPVLLAAVAAAAPPARGGRVSPLAALRAAAVQKGEEIGLAEPPPTREKRDLGRALELLDRAGNTLPGDLRAAVRVFPRLDRSFPGDPDLDPASGAALEALRQEVHGEQQGLLGWTGRTRSGRDRMRLQRGVMRVNDLMGRYDIEDANGGRARLLLTACRILDRTRRAVDLVPPRMDPAPFEGTAPGFLLVDQNPASDTAGRGVSPRDYLGQVSAFFFMASTWPYCRDQLGSLDRMQAEVLAARPSSRIRVLAVNRAGAESANAVAVEGKTIPLLQDTAADAAWAAWRVREHDVVILDGENDALGLYSLTLHDLSFAPDYDALLDYLRLAAGE